jgi:hypothetical protein
MSTSPLTSRPYGTFRIHRVAPRTLFDEPRVRRSSDGWRPPSSYPGASHEAPVGGRRGSRVEER